MHLAGLEGATILGCIGRHHHSSSTTPRGRYLFSACGVLFLRLSREPGIRLSLESRAYALAFWGWLSLRGVAIGTTNGTPRTKAWSMTKDFPFLVSNWLQTPSRRGSLISFGRRFAVTETGYFNVDTIGWDDRTTPCYQADNLPMHQVLGTLASSVYVLVRPCPVLLWQGRQSAHRTVDIQIRGSS